MSQRRTQKQSLPAVTETRLGVAWLADRVCEATRQAALAGAGSALSILAADQSPALPDAIRDIADRALARAAVMQIEFDRFRAAVHRAAPSLSAQRDEKAGCREAAFVDLATHRANRTGHGRAPAPVHPSGDESCGN